MLKKRLVFILLAGLSSCSSGVVETAAERAQLTRAIAQQELHCLALNVYWEARSEPLDGRYAVASVTLNRVQNDAFPGSVCDVVRQGGERNRHACQFSWWCDGKSDRPREFLAWEESLDIAASVLRGERDDNTNGAMYYHADYVQPAWANRLTRTKVIGRHSFYSDRLL